MLVLLAFVSPLSAQDVLSLGGWTRTGVANQTISVPVIVKDVAGTPAGADRTPGEKIQYLSLPATFDNIALVSPCGTAGNCTFLEAGIAPAITVSGDPNDPCGAADGMPDTPCYYRALTTTAGPVPVGGSGDANGDGLVSDVDLFYLINFLFAGGPVPVSSCDVNGDGMVNSDDIIYLGNFLTSALKYTVAFSNALPTSLVAPRGNLVGYLKLKLAPTFPAGGSVTISLDPSAAYVSGYDVYTPSTEETVANSSLTVSTFQPADANTDGLLSVADLTQVINDVEAAPATAVTGTNFSSDCDSNGTLNGADILCVYTELSPSTVDQHRLLDVDTDGNVDALTDGVLIVRRLFSFSGTALTSGALAAGARRTDPAAIAAYIDSIRPALDIDKDGTIGALSDGVLTIRYLGGLSGTALTSEAMESGATRTTAEVESYLTALSRLLP